MAIAKNQSKISMREEAQPTIAKLRTLWVNSHWARHPSRYGINQWNECYGKWSNKMEYFHWLIRDAMHDATRDAINGIHPGCVSIFIVSTENLQCTLRIL